MKLVIDIPEKWLNDMVREEFAEVDELCAIIQHSIPLEQEPCEDFIDRADAMTEIMMFAGNKKHDDDIYIKVSDAVELMRGLPSVNPQEPKTGWIPVSERLPEEDGRYLAYIINKYDNGLQYIMACDYMADTYWKWFPDDECASDNVVAWMPLPEPYKEG